MAEYIDANRLLDDIEITPFEDYGDYETAKAVILRQPAADVRENVRGEWIYNVFDDETGIGNTFFCSVCGKPQGQIYDSYCAACGADMRGDDNEID